MRKTTSSTNTVPYVKPKTTFLFLKGKERYFRMMPIPYIYIEPNYKLLKQNIDYAKK